MGAEKSARRGAGAEKEATSGREDATVVIQQRDDMQKPL